MAFDRENNVTIDDVAGFEVRFAVQPPASGEPDTGTLHVQLLLSNGKYALRQYNLLLRLGDDAAGLAHRAALASLRDYIRTRLENEVIPL